MRAPRCLQGEDGQPIPPTKAALKAAGCSHCGTLFSRSAGPLGLWRCPACLRSRALTDFALFELLGEHWNAFRRQAPAVQDHDDGSFKKMRRVLMTVMRYLKEHR